MLTPEQKQSVYKYLLANLPLLRNRDYLIELLTHTDRALVQKIRSPDYAYRTVDPGVMYEGKLVAIRDDETQSPVLYAVTSYTKHQLQHDMWCVNVIETEIVNTPEIFLSPQDILTVDHTQVVNIPEGTALQTSVGRVMLNYIILVDPFGATFPYINTEWVPNKISKLIANALIDGKIDTKQMQRYTENLYSFGHACELGVPVYSKKMLSVNPAIKQRREELLAQNAEALKRGDAVAMANIEHELVNLDRADFKGDDAEHFLIQGKNWNVHRKKLYLTVGMSEDFGGNGFNFIRRPLSEGWDVHDMPIIANEIRSMSYSRAKETAIGGEKAKFIMRVFQNTRVTEEDCGTKNGMIRYIDRHNLDTYLHRSIMVGGKRVVLTRDNIGEYADKFVQLRSPMQCQTQNGNYCYTCMGEVWRRLNQDRTVMVAADISAWITSGSLKRAHSGSVSTFSIESLNDYCF